MYPWKIWALLMAGLLLFEGAPADAKSKPKLEANELPMEVVGGYLLVVHASIGDRHNLNFLLDTGATMSAIDRALAERLNLASRSSQMVNFDKKLQIQWCILSDLMFGPERATNVKVVIQDLRYLRAAGATVDGVIGWDLLRRNSFRLDFANKRVVFEPISPAAAERHSVPFRESWLCLTVPIDLDGRKLWMVADTGMRGAMFYEPQLAATSYEWRASISGRSVGGNFDSQIAMVPRLRIGAQDLDRHVYLVRPPNSTLVNGIAGYLGISSLNAKQVTFDLDRRVLSWQ
jgi:hypothetical protein